MTNLYSQYTSGDQFPAGNIAGSLDGISGLNPIVDVVNGIIPSRSIQFSISSGSTPQVVGSHVINYFSSGDVLMTFGTISAGQAGSYALTISGTILDTSPFGTSSIFWSGLSVFETKTQAYDNNAGLLISISTHSRNSTRWFHRRAISIPPRIVLRILGAGC